MWWHCTTLPVVQWEPSLAQLPSVICWDLGSGRNGEFLTLSLAWTSALTEGKISRRPEEEEKEESRFNCGLSSRR